MPHCRHRSQGFGALAAIIVLVMLSAMAAAVVRLSWAAQATATQDQLGAAALQASNAGLEWGVAQALGPTGLWRNGCGEPHTLDLRSDTAMRVTVTCVFSRLYQEGQDPDLQPHPVRVFTLRAVACNGVAAACPDDAAAAGDAYIERRRSVQVGTP